MTLAEGLAEYYRDNPGLKRGDALSAPAAAFFRSHDAVHVVYGRGTSLPDEAVVKLASLFGTTGGLSVLGGYALHDSQDIYRTLRLSEILRTLVAAVIIVPRTLVRCLRQSRPWPWTDFEALRNQPLRDIRRRFGIAV